MTLFVCRIPGGRPEREGIQCLTLNLIQVALGSDATLLDLDPLTHAVVSPSRELDTCKFTPPHMIKNMAPIAQGQTARCRRRIASHAIGRVSSGQRKAVNHIWSANHPEISFPLN